MNAAEIQLGLQKLNVLGRVLYVAAHPDDENTNLMALWSNGSLYDTAYLSLTRGDGGQNLLGPELRERLGESGRANCSQPVKLTMPGSFSPVPLTSDFRKAPTKRSTLGSGQNSIRRGLGDSKISAGCNRYPI